MKKILLLFIVLIFLTGCSQKTIYQIDGRSVPDNVIQAKTMSLDLKIKYNLVKVFDVKEGDEFYEDYEFLPLASNEILKIEKPKNIVSNIDIFNPLKNEYVITKYITLEGGEAAVEELYSGNISRNSISVGLPLVPNKLISFYWDACNKNGDLVFRSFKVQYLTEK